MEESKISEEIFAYTRRRLGKGAKIAQAQQDASYKGLVVLCTNEHLVQAIGAFNETAIVHRMRDLKFVSSDLRERKQLGRLGYSAVQVDYTGDKAVVHSWDGRLENATVLYARVVHKLKRHLEELDQSRVPTHVLSEPDRELLISGAEAVYLPSRRKTKIQLSTAIEVSWTLGAVDAYKTQGTGHQSPFRNDALRAAYIEGFSRCKRECAASAVKRAREADATSRSGRGSISDDASRA